MKEVLEDILNHLSEKVSTFTHSNIRNAVEDHITAKYNCPPIPMSRINKKKNASGDLYIGILMYLLATNVNIKDDHTEPFNWETNFIESWTERFIKSKKYPWLDWKNFAYEALINDFFTMKGQDISLLDIAHLFSVYDFAALPLEVSSK